MVTFTKTGDKESGANVYKVAVDGVVQGYLYKGYEMGAGRWCAGYLGHFEGGFKWQFQDEEHIHYPHYMNRRFDTLKDAKGKLPALLATAARRNAAAGGAL